MNGVSESRFNGIIELGDHLVLLYESESNITETVVSYITNSLKNNHKFIYISGDTDTLMIINSLKQLNLYNSFVESNQLLFLDKKDAYSKSGKFNPDKMKDLLIELAIDAQKEGYEGLAISGELSWVLDYDEGFDLINEYEWKINSEVFGRYPVTALCRYNMDKFTDEMIINVIQLHPFLIINNKVYENPFYIPAIAYETNDIAKYQVKTWLENIVNFSSTKSEFNERLQEKEDAYEYIKNELVNEIIYSMIGLLELHNEYTSSHSENVAKLARKLAQAMGFSREKETIVYYTALIHDIGKIKVPAEYLDKTTSLTFEEYNLIKKHPEWGAQALNHSGNLDEVAKYILHHHEFYDGNGYPDQISKEEIPLVSRMISVCDAYDAMTNDRPYRNAYTKGYAIQELMRCKGKQFDPNIVDIFIDNVL